MNDRSIWVRLRAVLDRSPDSTRVELNRESAEEMLAEITRLRAANERLRGMVQEAYNAGFGQGMKDATSSRGAKTWVDSRFPALLATLEASDD